MPVDFAAQDEFGESNQGNSWDPIDIGEKDHTSQPASWAGRILNSIAVRYIVSFAPAATVTDAVSPTPDRPASVGWR